MKPEIIRVRVRVLGYCDLAKIVYSTVHGIGTRINSYSYRRPLSGRYTTATGGSSLWSESGTVQRIASRISRNYAAKNTWGGIGHGWHGQGSPESKP